MIDFLIDLTVRIFMFAVVVILCCGVVLFLPIVVLFLLALLARSVGVF